MKKTNIFAMVFPGQGSQKIGMLYELSKKDKIIKDTFDEASSVLGYDLWSFVNNGPISKLNKTKFTQPALLVSSVAIWRIWLKNSMSLPTILAGHSLGEYSALVCSGSLNFIEAVKLVEFRGKLMEKSVYGIESSMCAIIGLSSDEIKQLCQITSNEQIVSISSFNSPNQTVISGHKKAVEKVAYLCKERGAKYISFLSVNVPSHCILMRPITTEFSQILKKTKLYLPSIPVINNVDVSIEYDPKCIRQALIRQLYKPVRWNEIMHYIINSGIKILFEVGPGKVLSKLAKEIVGFNKIISINDSNSLDTALKYID